MSMEYRPFDADNHYYETLDAFTRYLDPKFAHRGVQVVKKGSHTEGLADPAGYVKELDMFTEGEQRKIMRDNCVAYLG